MEPLTEDEVVAEFVHTIWSEWMEYLFRHGPVNEDGSFTIPATQVSKWKRQMVTPLKELPEEEQVTDFDIAHRFLELIK